MFVFSLIVVAMFLTFNLWLTFALLRRVRAIKAKHTAVPSAPLPDRGTKPLSFSIVDKQGSRLNHRDLAKGRIFVVFLHPETTDPEKFRPTLETLAADDAPLLAAVVAHRLSDAEMADLVPLVPARARVFETEHAEQLASALGVRAYPAVICLADGVVAGAGSSMVAKASVGASR